jgi:hypothetical protein
MSGKSKQDKAKRDRGASDMSEPPDPPPSPWTPPPPDECEEATFTHTPNDADPQKEQFVTKFVTHITTGVVVGWVLVQKTRHQGKWRTVLEADSKHETAHFHRYGRSNGDYRIGEREVLMDIASEADVTTGYESAWSRVVDDWARNKQRWHDA